MYFVGNAKMAVVLRTMQYRAVTIFVPLRQLKPEFPKYTFRVMFSDLKV